MPISKSREHKGTLCSKTCIAPIMAAILFHFILPLICMLISGFIRILKYKEYFLTKETTTKNEIVLRLFNNKEEAEELVVEHLETYDQMWDGCGCKVKYYS